LQPPHQLADHATSIPWRYLLSLLLQDFISKIMS
jgi:hypothetical protein